MNRPQNDETHVRVKIMMNRSFSQFDLREQEKFLNDLSIITGSLQSDFKGVSFRRGCVIFEGMLPKEAWERLFELYQNRSSRDNQQDLADLRKFLSEHSVSRITNDFEIRFQILPKQPRHQRAIIFIHGWQGNSDSFGLMPKLLSEKFDCASEIYPYPTGILSESPSLTFVARNLDNWFRNKVDYNKVAIVAHSMGGLLTRKFLVSQSLRKHRLDEFVKQITFIASPHNGAVLASIAKYVSLHKEQLNELSPNSSFLFELTEQWMHWASQFVPAKCQVRSIFGTKDTVVSANNARGLDVEAVPLLGAGHIDIVKPINADSEVVLTVARFLREASF
jgi:hypothetical protein